MINFQHRFWNSYFKSLWDGYYFPHFTEEKTDSETLNNSLTSGGDRNQTQVPQILKPVALLSSWSETLLRALQTFFFYLFKNRGFDLLLRHLYTFTHTLLFILYSSSNLITESYTACADTCKDSLPGRGKAASFLSFLWPSL